MKYLCLLDDLIRYAEIAVNQEKGLKKLLSLIGIQMTKLVNNKVKDRFYNVVEVVSEDPSLFPSKKNGKSLVIKNLTKMTTDDIYKIIKASNTDQQFITVPYEAKGFNPDEFKFVPLTMHSFLTK
jgi:hypothetical protein